MKRIFETAASTLLTLAAVSVAVTVVHREFYATGRTDRGNPPIDRRPSYHAEWRSMLSDGEQIGDPAATIKVIEFVDLECPACRHYHETVLPDIIERYGDTVSVVFVHFPLSIHRFARPAAIGAECAAAQRAFRPFIDVVFAKQDSLGLKSWGSYGREAGIADTSEFSRCVQSPPQTERIDAGLALATRLQLRATPSVMVNGWLFAAAPGAEELSRTIQALLAGRSPLLDLAASER